MRRKVREHSSICNIGLIPSEKSVELVTRATPVAIHPHYLPEQRSPSSNQQRRHSLRCSSIDDCTMSPSEFLLEETAKMNHTRGGDHHRYDSEELSPSSTASSERSTNSISTIVDQRPESVHLRLLLNKAERSEQLKDRKQEQKERRKRRRSRLIHELKRNISEVI